MSYEIVGKLLEKSDIQNITDTFKKREFVIELSETIATGAVIVNYVKFQLTQNKCDLIDNYAVGSDLKINFNIRGNKWEKEGKVSYFTNLEAWRIESAASSGSSAVNSSNEDISIPESNPNIEDLPF